MSVDIDYSKPLSEEVIADLKARLPLETVQYHIERAEREANPEKTPKAPKDAGQKFDPSDKSVDEVLEYLMTADAQETERVKSLEVEGKGRKGILEV